MSRTKKDPQVETGRISLRSLFDKILSTLESEIDNLPETLQQVPPERRLDFISKNLPLLLKYQESVHETDWTMGWGE
jgi:hypothetical protein